MTDNGNLFTGQQHTASVTAYRADGWKVFFSFVLDGNDPVASANTRIAELAANGYSATAPGAPEGCKLEMIGWVVRRRQINKDGRPDTPILDLYLDHEAWNGRLVGIYLNTPEEVAAFEKASGRKLESFPLFDGDVPAKRDNPRTSQYVIRLTAPIGAYIGDNPQYEGENDKTHQKRKFFGWKDAPLTAPTADAPAPAANVTPAPTPEPPAPLREVKKDYRPADVHVDENGEVVIDGVPERTMINPLDAAGLPSANEGKPVPPVVSTPWIKSTVERKRFIDWAMATYTMSIPSVLAALDVKTLTDYKGTLEEARAACDTYSQQQKKATG